VILAEDAKQATKKVLHVVVGVKADEIGAQQAIQDKSAPWCRKEAEQLVSREWNMEKESNGCIRDSLAEIPRQEHQMIIMDPDDVPWPCDFNKRFTEGMVDLLILLPVIGSENCQLGKVVEEWPDGFVAESLIEVFYIFLGEKDGVAMMVIERQLFDIFLELIGDRASGPTHPDILECAGGIPSQ
jgi:hypothetical protein